MMKKENIVYFNGRFLPENEVIISPNDRGFMFADGTYDVLRSFSGKLFHGEEHFKRLAYCLDELRIMKPDLNELKQVVNKLLIINGLDHCEASIYIQITRGEFRRMHVFPTEMIEPTIYITVKNFIPYKEEFVNGVKCITVEDIRWQRCDIKTIALLANVLAVQKAHEEGAYEAIFIRNGIVTEASHSSVFGVLDGIIYTHPKNNHILSGISREILIDLCIKNNLNLIEEPIPESKLGELQELMVVGTSTEVMPVVKLNDQIVGDGKPGKISVKLHKYFKHYMELYYKKDCSNH